MGGGSSTCKKIHPPTADPLPIISGLSTVYIKSILRVEYGVFTGGFNYLGGVDFPQKLSLEGGLIIWGGEYTARIEFLDCQ